MKINVTVDLGEMFTEYEDGGSFQEEILNDISNRVKHQIWKTFQDSGLALFQDKISRDIDQTKDEEMERIITKIFSEKKIRSRTATKNNPEPEMITLFEYIEEKLTKVYLDPESTAEKILSRRIESKELAFDKIIETNAQVIFDKLKNRYDLLFASQIVLNLNKSGLLKEDISSILLNNKNETP